MKVVYQLIDGEVTGGNVVALNLIEAALDRGWEPVATAPRDGPLLEGLRQRGVRVRHVDVSRTHKWDGVPRLARVLHTERADLLHVHDSFGGTCLAPLAARVVGVPAIVHAHVTSPLSRRAPVAAYQRALLRASLGTSCAAVVAVAEAVRDAFVALGAPPGRCHVVPNGAPRSPYGQSDRASLREKLGWSSDAFVVVHVGRLTPTKGQDILVRASSLLGGQRVNMRVVLVGEDLAHGGEHRAHLEQLVSHFDLQDTVEFAGHHPDVQAVLAAADVLVLPSCAEGMPIVVLEAMAAGLPVVATAAGGTAEAVVQDVTGLLVDRTPEAFATALLELAADERLRRRMGTAGRERHAREFTVERMVERTWALYEEVLA